MAVVRTRGAADEVGGDGLVVSLNLFGGNVSGLVLGALSRCWRGVGLSRVAEHNRGAHPSCAGGCRGSGTEGLGRLAEKRHGVCVCVCGDVSLRIRIGGSSTDEKVSRRCVQVGDGAS